jgi:hypothetical protein
MLNHQRVLIAGSTKVLSASFFPWLPICPTNQRVSGSAQKRFGTAHPQFGSMLCTFLASNWTHRVYYRPQNMHNMDPKCVWAAPVLIPGTCVYTRQILVRTCQFTASFKALPGKGMVRWKFFSALGSAPMGCVFWSSQWDFLICFPQKKKKKNPFYFLFFFFFFFFSKGFFQEESTCVYQRKNVKVHVWHESNVKHSDGNWRLALATTSTTPTWGIWFASKIL